MKNGKRPTRKQMEEIKKAGLIPENWLIVKNTPTQFLVQHRYSGETKDLMSWE